MIKDEAVGPTLPPTPMSGAPDVLLESLVAQDESATVPDLAHRLGLHANTVRAHLAALISDGLVERASVPAQGRGRPAHAFRPSAAGRAALQADSVFAEYRGLSAAFVDFLAQAPGDPTEQARSIGQAWGRQWAASEAVATTQDCASPPDAVIAAQANVVDLLREMRFDPAPDDDGIALRTCPLLDVAQRVPQVICQVHHGLVEGALEHYGAPEVAVELVPFAEPGACRLRLS